MGGENTGLWVTGAARAGSGLTSLSGAHVVWHMFDEGADIDVGVATY